MRAANSGRAAIEKRLADAGISIEVSATTGRLQLGSHDPMRLLALPGCKVTPELLDAFTEVSADSSVAERAISRRCWQLLESFDGSLLRDLALLADHALITESSEQLYWQFMLTHYYKVRSLPYPVAMCRRSVAVLAEASIA